MSFIRPEAAANLFRWREALIGLAVLALGAWWALTLNGILSWVGMAFCVAGLVLTVTGLQRGRFRSNTGGPGIVQIDEGRVTYFGPLTGGSIDLSEMTELALDPTGQPAHWRLSQPGQPQLFIPVSATGNDALFDAFSSLPGLRSETLVAAANNKLTIPTRIWVRHETLAKLRG
ncbi:hypothetical protein [Roseovarius phycicola]|uniref:DUF3239 domain-containing protein n=1 Tax=Roseovarius phycicola TaxID=3080976 RepID=A0ABZ2HEF3_9RHOB